MGRGRAPCCQKVGLNKGPWSPAEDMKLVAYIHKYGHGNWRALPRQAGLLRCGKSCRLRWINYLRPDIKRGNFSPEEEEMIIKLHAALGNKWSKIASRLPGRTDNEIKNVWNTYLKKRLMSTEPNTSVDEQKESLSSSSSNSTLSHCDPGEAMGKEEQVQPAFRCGSPPEVSGAILQADENQEEHMDVIIEIPIETNVDFWDLLDNESCHLPENNDGSSNNNTTHMCSAHFKNRSAFQVPDLPIHELKESSSSSSNSDDVCSNPAGGKGPEDQPHPLSNFDGADDFHGALHSQCSLGHMEEFPHETPFDPRLNFWGMLEEDLSAFPSTVGSMDELGALEGTVTEEESRGEVDGKSWITYLENELELWATGNENQQSPMEGGFAAPGPTYGGLVEAENDPVITYFQIEP